MDHQIDQIDPPGGVGIGDPRHTVNGTSASAGRGVSDETIDGIAVKAAGVARTSDEAMTRVMGDGDNSAWVSSILCAASLAIIAFQIAYVVLDAAEYPQTLARTVPLHVAGLTLGLVALMAALSPRAIRNWRAISLVIYTAILLTAARIAAIESDSTVLVAGILMFFFSAGAMLPWNPRWQVALEACGAIALLRYSTQAVNPDARLAIAWTMVVSALVLSQMTSIHSARYRRKLAEQLAALADNHRLIKREMDLRAEIATARERDLVRLQASQSMLRKIFDATLDIIVVTRLSDGSYIDFNQQFVRLGYGQQDLDDSRKGQRQIWASEEQHQKFRERVIGEGIVRDMEVDFILPDGGLMPALLAAVRVELQGEDCVVTMIRDLTAAREASRRLEQSLKALSDSEETFRRLFDANLDSMTLTGPDGVYISVNREFVRASGFSREETIGHHFSELNLWIHQDEMRAFANRLARTREVRNVEVALRNKDGSERPVLISAVFLELQGRLCCLTVSRGISDLKMTQRELVGAREAALAASRAKSEFLSSMSHEIRTPMNAILGMADQLMETRLDAEQRKYLTTVIRNGHALLKLIDGILDLAKVESGRISLEAVEFNPKDVTEKVLETLAIRAHEKGLELMARFAAEIPEVVLGDLPRLGQILINLVGNAIKFTEKGQVLVSVERDPDSTAAGALKFTVTDTGVGIPTDKRHLLFHAFSQADSSTSRKYGGSGLGLAIVSRLVALMHGKVEVATEPGTGSAFSFTAQFGMATARPAAPLARALPELRIMLVDDNADSRSIIADLLRAQRAIVTEVSSGTEALAELRLDDSRQSHFEVVLLDGAMPARGAFEAAECLMRGGPGQRRIVMMLGTNDLTAELARLRAIGVDHYIVKPVRRAELYACIARARDGPRVEPHGNGRSSRVIAPASTSPVLDRPLHILMADDSHDNRALIRAYLKKTPYRLEEAEDGRQAIDKFIAGKFDLVLMDIQMPIVDGYEATTAIRGWERANNRTRTPIVALTASALEEAVHRTKAAGCDAHVTKPVRKATLLDAIRDATEPNRLDDERADVTDLKEETCRTE